MTYVQCIVGCIWCVYVCHSCSYQKYVNHAELMCISSMYRYMLIRAFCVCCLLGLSTGLIGPAISITSKWQDRSSCLSECLNEWQLICRFAGSRQHDHSADHQPVHQLSRWAAFILWTALSIGGRWSPLQPRLLAKTSWAKGGVSWVGGRGG